MRNQFPLLIILLVVTYSCKNKPASKDVRLQLKDSLLNKINTLEEADTTENYYKILKAYTTNDTGYLRKYISDIERYNNAVPPLHFIDSCARQPNLQDLNVNEAYRFVYRTSFCPYDVNITIAKAGDDAKLHFVIYEQKEDSLICVNEYDKSLAKKDWDDIVKYLIKSDFWGRRKYNGMSGLDGSELTVIGFKKGESGHRSLYNHVYRWIFREEPLMEPFKLALRLSGNKQGCIITVE